MTIVTYEPDTAGIREMLRAASDSYVELQRQFDLVIADFLQQLDLAQDDLNATLEQFVSQFNTTGTLDLSDEALQAAIEQVKATVNLLVEDAIDTTKQAKDIFEPNFPTQEIKQLSVLSFDAISFKQTHTVGKTES